MRCRKSVVREWHCLLGLLLFSICIVCSCEDSDERRVAKMIEDWTGRTILMPKESVFTLYGGDTVSFLKDYICADYKIINYVDSTDCVSCKLQISSWKVFLATLDSVGTDLERIIPVLFYMCPKESAELKFILHREGFNYPICIDEKDSLNKLNHFPSDINYQTFLLDKDNKVLAIGNPVLNPKVKDLYLRIIRGESPQASSDAGTPVTTVSVCPSGRGADPACALPGRQPGHGAQVDAGVLQCAGVAVAAEGHGDGGVSVGYFKWV